MILVLECPGDRLAFLRKKLNLTFKDVADNTGIPLTTCKNIEYGVRCITYVNYEILANYLNRAWQVKFAGTNYPTYKNKKIKEITFPWILLGQDRTLSEIEFLLNEIENGYYERELRYIAKIAELENKITTYDKGEK